jgi:hypothetical protein
LKLSRSLEAFKIIGSFQDHLKAFKIIWSFQGHLNFFLKLNPKS